MKEIWGKIEFSKYELIKTEPNSFISYLIKQWSRVCDETYKMNKNIEEFRKTIKEDNDNNLP